MTAVAAILNRYFICIKIDREERPDLDDIYCQLPTTEVEIMHGLLAGLETIAD